MINTCFLFPHHDSDSFLFLFLFFDFFCFWKLYMIVKRIIPRWCMVHVHCTHSFSSILLMIMLITLMLLVLLILRGPSLIMMMIINYNLLFLRSITTQSIFNSSSQLLSLLISIFINNLSLCYQPPGGLNRPFLFTIIKNFGLFIIHTHIENKTSKTHVYIASIFTRY